MNTVRRGSRPERDRPERDRPERRHPPLGGVPRMGPKLPSLGRRSDMILRIGAVALVIAGVLGAGVEGWLGRAALILAGLAGLAAPPNLGRTGAPPGRRGMVALGALVAALLMMFLAITSGG